jgi:hypothetical protein
MTDATAKFIARLLLAAGLLAFAAGALYRYWPRAAPTPAAVSALVSPQPLAADSSGADGSTPPAARLPARSQAEFGAHPASREVRRVANWAVSTDDPRGRPFMVVDKKRAALYVFDAGGVLAGKSPVLLGQARGDYSVPGIGDREVSLVRPFERTTPAGRFVTATGRNALGEDVIWIDYAAAVSMHRVRATVPEERRLQRLASRSWADNRISFGCINVPTAFYDEVVRPLFYRAPGLAYVLPEVGSLHQVFAGLPPGA